MEKKIILSLAFLLVLTIFLAAITSALSQCNDGVDNDCDGKIDMADNGCDSYKDNSEDIVIGYANGCLKYGDILKNSCGATTYECGHDSCPACILMSESGNYTTISYRCYGLPACGFNSPNSHIDKLPPDITINNPLEGNVETSRSVLLDIEVNEDSKLERYDSYRRKWIVLCTRCLHYSRKLSFKEGQQEITIRATDRTGNEAYKNISFYVDSKKPQIHRTEPRSEYASGLFEIQYTEENLASIELIYGNDETGFEDAELKNCSSGKRVWCSADVDLKDYDGQKIEYYFIVTDIAGNSKKSQIRQNLNVDTILPVLNNPDDFWKQGVGRDSKYMYFKINITEKNFDEVSYIDYFEGSRAKWKTLCSRLKNGICEKKVSFRRGEHVLDVQISDKAGNAIGEGVEFVVDY